MEEYAYILDYMPQGLSGGNFSKKEPICYALGDTEFKLFELVPKAGAAITIGERVYIGKDAVKRTAIDHVKRRITYDDLSSNAMSEMEYTVTDIVMADQAKYISFFNSAQEVNLRKHMLEELPGLGKKSMITILDERKKGDFKDFADLNERTKIKTPEKLIAARIILEIKDSDRKRYIFVSK